VYWGNGCQIIPPHDAGIAAAIEANLELWQLPSLEGHPLLSDPTTAVTNTYYKALAANLHYCSKEDNGAAAPAVYTPLHGVGLLPVQRAFSVSWGCGLCVWGGVGGV
jgi:phosphomannomutase